MRRYVLDSSVAVEYLLRTPVGYALDSTINNAEIVAPELIDAEVVSVLRKDVLSKRLSEARALTAIDDLARWHLVRIPHRALLRLAWKHFHVVTAYDGLYVAAAHQCRAVLLTADGRLSRAPGLGVAIQHIRLS